MLAICVSRISTGRRPSFVAWPPGTQLQSLQRCRNPTRGFLNPLSATGQTLFRAIAGHDLSRPSQDTIKDRVSIHERPKTVDGRTEGDHWEGDLVICKRTRPVLVLHERKSRVTLAARLAGKTAAETISVMLAVFARIEPALRKSNCLGSNTPFQAILKELGKDVQIRFA